MAYEYSFMDNQLIGVDHLNALSKRFVTSGVEDLFQNGLPYNVSKFNDVIKANGSSGVVPEGVNTLKVTKQGEGTVTVQTGTAFFENGSSISVTSPEVLAFTKGERNYVYVKSDLVNNRNFPVCSTAAPSGDFVLLAEVDGEGNVTDKRKYAQGKLPGYQSNANVMLEKELVFTYTGMDIHDYVFDSVAQTVYFGENNNYTCLLLVCPPLLNSGSAMALVSFSGSTITYLRTPGSSGGSQGMDTVPISQAVRVYNGQGSIDLTVRKTGDQVTVTADGELLQNASFTIQAYAF